MDNEDAVIVGSRVAQVGRLRSFWQTLSRSSLNRKILTATATIAVASAAVKAAALVKTFLIAWRMGTGGVLDAYYIAVLVITFATTVTAGSLSFVVIPTFVRVHEQGGRPAAQKLFTAITALAVGLLVLTAIVVVTAGPLYLPLVAAGFDPDKRVLTFGFICATVVAIPLSGMASIYGSILIASERFLVASLASILNPTAFVLLLVLNVMGSASILAVAMVVGAALECFALGIAVKRQGFKLLPRWRGFTTDLREIGGQFSFRAAVHLLRSGSNVANQSMAARLASGSVAALNYGTTIVMGVRGLIGSALGFAVAPFFSRLVALKDWKEQEHLLKRYLVAIFLLTVPVTILLFVFSEPLIRALYQRGSFTASDTLLVAQIQALYVLQLPFAIAHNLLARLMSALLKSNVTMWVAGASLIMNVALNVLFIRKIGVAGVALATSLTLAVSFCVLTIYSLRVLRLRRLAQPDLEPVKD